MTDPIRPRWRVTPGADLRWRRWNDEVLIHHGLSNDTHRLSAWAAELLLALAELPDADLAMLAASSQLDIEDVDEAMTALQALELVELC